jgi:putative ABC transport system substrate-binding protein
MRGTVLRSLIVAVAMAVAVPALAQVPGWLKPRANALAGWQITTDPADPNRARVRRAGAAGGEVDRILVLQPWPSSAYDTAISTLLQSFAERARGVEFTLVNLDNKPASGVPLLRRAQADGFRMVFAVGSESAELVYEHYNGGALPVVTVCAKDPVQMGWVQAYERGSGTNIAYTSLNMPTSAQASYLLQLKPDLAQVAILADSRNVSALKTQAEPLAAALAARGVVTRILSVEGRRGMAEHMPGLMREALVEMRASDPKLERSLFWIIGATAVFSEIALIDRNAGGAAVLSVVPDVVQPGEASAALSVGVTFQSNARLAAAYAFSILDRRTTPGELRVGVVEPPDIAVNFLKTRQQNLKVPFGFFELAGFVYDAKGAPVRLDGRRVGTND